MKYLKSYKESTDWLLTEMEEYFSNIEYDLSVSKDRMTHNFEYKGDKYKIIMRNEAFHHVNGDLSYKWVPDLYSYDGDLPLYRNISKLYLTIFKIDSENLYLIQTILLLFKKKSGNTHIDSNNSDEIKDRFEEFDVLKDGHIDYISLESLFGFYEQEFEKWKFQLTLDRVRSRKITY